MGVPKLWDELEPAIRVTTWAQLAAPAFDRAGVRGFRLGVDIAQWLFHMGRMNTLLDADGNEVHPGANADLRMVFYRVCDFLAQGVLAVFVFDGPDRPSWKRDKHVAGAWRGRSERDIITMLELMGMEWRRAPGEAEAELAEMSRRGEVDAILSDDVDSLLFGVTKMIRNPGKGLSGNKSKRALSRQTTTRAESTSASPPPRGYPPVPPDSDVALVSYTSDDVATLTGLGRDELILVALMSGADYDTQGIERVGNTISVALARAGFATELLDGIRRLRSSSPAGDPSISPESRSRKVEDFLAQWRASVAEELRTNSRGLMSRREKKLADTVQHATGFPSLKIVDFYLEPRVSDPRAVGYAPPGWDRDVDLAALVTFAQRKFEWGHTVLEGKLRSKVWLGLAMREARRAALTADGILGAGHTASTVASSSTPPVPSGWLASVHDLKVDTSTGFVPAYRIELSAHVFNTLVSSVLPADDPHPLPEYDLMPSDEERATRAKRKALGQAQDVPKGPSGSTAFRHWVPREIVEACEEGIRAARRWRDDVERKKREKDEAAAQKEERRRAREAGKSSPIKSSSRGSSSGNTPRTRRTRITDADDETRRDLKERKARAARDEMWAIARSEGMGHDRPDEGVSRLRGATRGGPAGLLSFGISTKPGSSTFTSTKPSLSSGGAGRSNPADIFSSPPTKQRTLFETSPIRRSAQVSTEEDVLTISSSDEAEDSAPARSRVEPLSKASWASDKSIAPRMARPAMTRPAAMSPSARAPAADESIAVVDLSSDDSFAYDSDDAILARKGNLKQPLDSPEHVSLTDFIASRREQQEKARQLKSARVLILDDSD